MRISIGKPDFWLLPKFMIRIKRSEEARRFYGFHRLYRMWWLFWCFDIWFGEDKPNNW